MEMPNPGEIELEKVEFSRDAMVFMLPKGSCTHPEEGEFPYIAISKHKAKEGIKFPIAERAFEIGMPVDCITVTTYTPESHIQQFYRKTVEIKPGQTIAEAMISEAGKFDRTNDGTPINDTNANNIRSEDIIETLWLTGIKILLAISGGKTQIKQGRRIKTEGEPPVSWYTPNYLDILNHPPHG